MFNECDKFSASHAQSQTSVGEVRLVVYGKDQSTFDVSSTASAIVHALLQGFNDVFIAAARALTLFSTAAVYDLE